jgi:hypothetical protein
MFEPTILSGEPELHRVSAFERYLHEPGGPRALGEINSTLTMQAALSPSLLADLSRFEQDGNSSEVLEVLAACVRHSQPVLIHLQMGDMVVPLTVFPIERLVHCAISLDSLLEQRPTELKVLHVEPAVLRPLGDEELSLVGDEHHHHCLRPLLWEFALRGARATLLPEIAGPAAYRVAPGLDLGDLRVGGAVLAGVQRLQGTSVALRDLAEWPGFDAERGARLLNALYLQAGLIVSRTSPAANTWFSALTGG